MYDSAVGPGFGALLIMLFVIALYQFLRPGPPKE
jgi:hypothetical protein